MSKIKRILISFTFLLSFIPGQAHAALYDDIQESLICPACIDERMTVATCTDSTAKATKQDIQNRLSMGQTKNQIIQAYVDKYGEVILAVPEKSGFNLLAWLLPPVSLVGGTFMVYYAITHWVNNSKKQKYRKKDQVIDSIDEERLNEEMLKYL